MTDAGLPYSLYGLADGNPYTHGRPLDPLERPADQARWLRLDGFVDDAPVVTHLRKAAEERRTAFMLIGGPNLTGRTSMANWVLARYCELRGVGDRFLPVRIRVGDHARFRWLRDAIAELADDVEQAELGLTAEVMDRLQSNLALLESNPYVVKIRSAARGLSVALDRLSQPYAFGVVFEGVPTCEFVLEAQSAFAGSLAVVVFTYDAYKSGQTVEAESFRRAQFEDILHVELPRLSNRQVCLLAEGRWAVASDRRCPFDASGLEYQYRDQVTPIKVALKRLADLLDYKLKVARRDLDWPANEDLFMSRDWLRATFELMENSS